MKKTSTKPTGATSYKETAFEGNFSSLEDIISHALLENLNKF